MANVVGQAFIQAEFQFSPAQLNRQALTAATALQNRLNQQLRGGQGRLNSAAQALGEGAGDSFSKGLRQRFTSGFDALLAPSKAFTKISTGIAAGFFGITAAAAAFSKQGIDAAKQLQNLEQSLKAIFGELDGTATKTNAFIASLRELSKASGQSFDQLGQSGRTLIATGLSAERTTEILTAFSKAAALSGASTRQFELALLGLTQVQAKGRLSSEELRRQIAENLPGAISVTKVYEQLAKQLGLTTKEVIKLQEAGGITADQGIQAILDAINETEGISRAFEARLQTLDGQLGVLRETLKEVVQVGFRPFVSALATGFATLQSSTAFADIQKELTDFSKVLGEETVKAIQEIAPLLPDLIKSFAEISEAIIPVLPDLVEMIVLVTQLSLPVLNLLADLTNFLLNGLGPFSDIIRELLGAASIAGLFSLLGKVVGVFKALGPVARATTGLFGTLGKVGGRFNKVIFAAVFLFQEFVKTIQSLVKAFQQLWQWAKNVVKALDFLNLSLGPLKDFAGAIGDVATSAFNGVKGFLGFNNEAKKTPAILNESLNPLNSLNTLFSQTIQKINEARGVLGLFRGTLLNISGVLGKTGDFFDNFVSAHGTEILANSLTKLADKFDGLADASANLKDAQKGVGDAQKNLNEILQEGRFDLEAIARAEDKVADAADGVADALDRVVDATQGVADANQALADSTQGVADAIQDEADAAIALAEARTPASASELSEAEDNITRARIAQAVATRALNKADEELDATETERVNLAGLSLDQIRTTIAGIRASAAAKRATTKDEGEDAKTAEELQEEQILREIDVRDSIRAVTDAEEELQELKKKGGPTDEDVIARQEDLAQASKDVTAAKRDEEAATRDVESAKRDEASAIRDVETAKRAEIVAQTELNTLRLGDPDFDERIAEARERITEAKQTEIEAQRTLNDLIAEVTGNEERIVAAKLEQLRLNKDLILQTPDLTREFVASFGNIGDFLRGPINPKFLGPDFIRVVAERLLNTPGSSLRDILKQLGVPGLMAGGVVTSPTLAHLGEFARPEAVMPLTHPGNFFKTWQESMPFMHPKIRDAFRPTLPKISGGGGRATSVKPSRSDVLLNEILLALQENAGRATIEAPITVNPGPGMDERLLARQIARKLRREIKRR